MTLNELRHQVLTLDLPRSDYLVFGSAPLLVHRLISQINDVDIVLRGITWDRFQGLEPKPAKYGDTVILLGDIELYSGWMGMNIDDLFARSTLIDGVRFASLEDVLKFKRVLNRPKDRAHMKLIESALAAKSSNLKTSESKLW